MQGNKVRALKAKVTKIINSKTKFYYKFTKLEVI